MTTQQQAAPAAADDTATALEHAEATAAETIGQWPACGCPQHGGAA
ncbi:hypothetical protein ACF064_01430 [Streptomyces sp. NPDC015492]